MKTLVYVEHEGGQIKDLGEQVEVQGFDRLSPNGLRN